MIQKGKISSVEDFYPRPLRGGRPVAKMSLASLVGFLSTPSARRATVQLVQGDDRLIHFYPRPLRGGRPRSLRRISGANRGFLSTPSARRATRSASTSACGT